jgi:anti-sigma regulatory factor (Ser/Thr protein kinase)
LHPVEIRIPARPEYVGVVRLALAALARGASIDEEKLDELKIAVSEACTNSVMSQVEEGDESPVRVNWHVDDSSVTIDVSGARLPAADERMEDTQGISTRLRMSEDLMRSLVDDYSVIEQDGGHVIRLKVAL